MDSEIKVFNDVAYVKENGVTVAVIEVGEGQLFITCIGQTPVTRFDRETALELSWLLGNYADHGALLAPENLPATKVPLVGKLVLAKLEPKVNNFVSEYNVIGASNDGAYLKFEHCATGRETWKEAGEVEIIEVLRGGK